VVKLLSNDGFKLNNVQKTFGEGFLQTFWESLQGICPKNITESLTARPPITKRLQQKASIMFWF